MTRKLRRRVQTASKKRSVSRSSPKTVKKRAATPSRADDLDTFITAAAKALDLPVRKAWLPAIKANLRVTLQLGSVITAFELPDDAEPAPVFRA